MLTSVPLQRREWPLYPRGIRRDRGALGLVALRGPGWRVTVIAAVCDLRAQRHLSGAARTGSQCDRSAPNAGSYRALERFAAEHHVGYGYASYWNAAELTWTTDFKLPIYPDQECGPEHRLCMRAIEISTWYLPASAHELAADRGPELLELPIRGLDRRLGRPSASTTIGGVEGLRIPVRPGREARREAVIAARDRRSPGSR